MNEAEVVDSLDTETVDSTKVAGGLVAGAPKLAREDFVALLGLIFLVAGVAWIYPAASLIILGLLLLFYAFVIEKKRKG